LSHVVTANTHAQAAPSGPYALHDPVLYRTQSHRQVPAVVVSAADPLYEIRLLEGAGADAMPVRGTVRARLARPGQRGRLASPVPEAAACDDERAAASPTRREARTAPAAAATAAAPPTRALAERVHALAVSVLHLAAALLAAAAGVYALRAALK
jgi:hypothetical protein